MIKSYKKLLEMESVALLRLEQDKKALERAHSVMYQKKEPLVNALIRYLKNSLSIDYEHIVMQDIDGNIADVLVRSNSELFNTQLKSKDILEYNIENLIDKRMFNSLNDIIIIDLSVDPKYLNIGYLCDSLEYKYLTYSRELKEKLELFVEYVLKSLI